jgi:ABC-type uncharacterized transport system substrate-binding protein
VFASERDKFPASPNDNNGKKWRIAYYEGGSNDNYYNYFKATINGLTELGWIEDVIVPDWNGEDMFSVWKVVSETTKSDYIEFPLDAFITANWNNNLRINNKKRFLNRLKKNDIDLILSMGTWAGKDLANNEHSVPTIVLSSSNPLTAGIIKSNEDSGYDHVHVRVDPYRYERQVKMFHDFVGFKKLGVAYENSVYGRSYAAINLIEKTANKQGFEITRCFTQSDIPAIDIAGKSVVNCFNRLAKDVDAIYVTVQGGVNDETIPNLVAIANKYRVPTFYQGNSDGVSKGFLFSMSRAGFRPVGLFHAATIAKIFNGAKPRELNQKFEEAPNIAINLKTAELVGIYLQADILAAADEIYQEIEKCK